MEKDEGTTNLTNEGKRAKSYGLSVMGYWGSGQLEEESGSLKER
jgi:hypothetical protein